MVLFHRDIYLMLIDRCFAHIIGSSLQMDGTLLGMKKGIEFVLCLRLSCLGIEPKGLGAIDRTKTCCSIECPATTSVTEAETGNLSRDSIGDDKTTKGDDAAE